jgi:hypothetical protein
MDDNQYVIRHCEGGTTEAILTKCSSIFEITSEKLPANTILFFSQ